VLTEPLHRLVAQQAEQAATRLRPTVLASLTGWRTAATRVGLDWASAPT
jgi:hypothetical protein